MGINLDEIFKKAREVGGGKKKKDFKLVDSHQEALGIEQEEQAPLSKAQIKAKENEIQRVRI